MHYKTAALLALALSASASPIPEAKPFFAHGVQDTSSSSWTSVSEAMAGSSSSPPSLTLRRSTLDESTHPMKRHLEKVNAAISRHAKRLSGPNKKRSVLD